MKKVTASVLASVLFCMTATSLEARILAGSISEKKQQTKVVSLLNTARKQVDKGKMQDAINTYWKVLEIDPEQPYAYLELGELYKNLRIYDRSAEMLTTGLPLAEKELDSDEVCNYYCILTEVYTETHQQGLSNKALLKAAEVAPRNPMPRKILGDIYLRNNRVANAAKAYKKALELDPDYSPALEALGELKAEYGDKLPGYDKDPDYIKRTAVELPKAPAKESTTTKESPKPAKLAEIKKEEADKKPVPAKAEPRPVPNKQIKVLEVKEKTEEPVNISNNQEDVIASSETTLEENNQEQVAVAPAKKSTKNERPIPLKKEDMPKPKAKQQKKDNSQLMPDMSPEEQEAFEVALNEHIDSLLEGTPAEKEEAINYFIKSGRPGLHAVEELIYEPDPDIKIIAIRCLPLFTDFREEVKAILKDASEDPDPDVQEEIAKTLEAM